MVAPASPDRAVMTDGSMRSTPWWLASIACALRRAGAGPVPAEKADARFFLQPFDPRGSQGVATGSACARGRMSTPAAPAWHFELKAWEAPAGDRGLPAADWGWEGVSDSGHQ